jgi:2,4-dienoyl-CoA reductase-like NADH-dependent reductase (Old Yellow Enzyme family)
VAGIQLAHAGRKASCDLPWKGGAGLTPTQGGWPVVGPSAVAFGPGSPEPQALTKAQMEALTNQFLHSTDLALQAGFQVVELHAAHGYLLHEFLSPLSNTRTDEFGGSLENRMRWPLHVAKQVRAKLPSHLPLFVRISATDWAEGGWDLEQSVVFAGELKKIGVDLIDCSTGGMVPHAKVPVGPHYQVPFAQAIRTQTGIATGAVGMITEPLAANSILAEGQADAVFLARELLRNPYWPARAMHALIESAQISAADKELANAMPWPLQYARSR